jgi:hypothetical protein
MLLKKISANPFFPRLSTIQMCSFIRKSRSPIFLASRSNPRATNLIALEPLAYGTSRITLISVYEGSEIVITLLQTDFRATCQPHSWRLRPYVISRLSLPQKKLIQGLNRMQVFYSPHDGSVYFLVHSEI